MDVGDLTDIEQRLVTALVDGTVVDLAAGVAGSTMTVEVMRGWGPQQRIRPGVIRELLRSRLIHCDRRADPHGLRLRGALIEGPLDAYGLTSSIPLELSHCYLPAGIDATHATLGGLRLRDCQTGPIILRHTRIQGPLTITGSTLTNTGTGPALDGEQLTTTTHTILTGITATAAANITATSDDAGTVRLSGASIGGQLDPRGASLTNAGTGPVLDLSGASIGGQLILRGATVTNTGTGAALVADRSTVTADAFLDHGFTATSADEWGTIGLPSASIGRQLSLRGATLTNTGTGPVLSVFGASIGGQLDLRGATLTNTGTGPALDADGATVTADAHLTGGFTATSTSELGTVRLPGASIGGQLSLRGATLTNTGTGPALEADRSTVTADASLEGLTATSAGELATIRLLGAKVGGRLRVSDEVVAAQGGWWVVDGLTYEGYPSCGWPEWLTLLREGTLEYAAQPYQQLAAAARAAGHDRDARTILMAQRRDRITRGRLGWWEKVWAWFAGFTLGFGYQPWRALLGLAFALGLALVLVFSSIGTNGLGPVTITNQSSTTSLDGTPISGPILTITTPQVECGAAERASVAVDIAIPLVKTTTSAACTPNTSYAGTWFTGLALFLRTVAWAAAALFVVGFTSIIRKT